MSFETLDWLLSPLAAETFIEQFWGRHPYLAHRSRADYFAGLFGEAALESVLEFGRPQPPAIRVVCRDDPPDASSYTLADGKLDLVRLRNDFAAGYTIVVNGLEHFWAPVADVVRGLQDEMTVGVQVNAYVTPPRSQGFLPHSDDHDVLVAQVAGAKTWRVFGEHRASSTDECNRRGPFSAEDLSRPVAFALAPGDVLYVPRGRIHEADTDSQFSIHLTIGIHVPTALDLLTKILDALSYREPALRELLPLGYLRNPAGGSGMEEIFRTALQRLEQQGSVADGIALLEDEFVRKGRCPVTGDLVSNTMLLPELTLQSLVERRRPLYSRVVMLEDGIGLQFAQSLTKASKNHLAAMLFVSKATEQFRVADIPELDDDSKLELVRKLVTDGLLVLPPMAHRWNPVLVSATS